MTPDALRSHLSRLGLTQAGFGRLAGYADRTVRQWIGGQADMPRPAVLLLDLIETVPGARERLQLIHERDAPPKP